jgi:hypothetical protein
MDDGDMGMVQLSQKLGLTLEAGQAKAIHQSPRDRPAGTKIRPPEDGLSVLITQKVLGLYEERECDVLTSGEITAAAIQ